MVFGSRRTPRRPAGVLSGGAPPRGVLTQLLLPALARPPCRIAFSGGRDSSALLALATRLARDHGLEDPLPLTLRFASHPRTAETEWQELVVRHLGLDGWEIVAVADELDAVGPVAGPALLRHGLYWPPNAHTLGRLLRSAEGGVLVTGNGGDEVFSPWVGKRPGMREYLRARPRRRALKYGLFDLLPRRARIRLWVRRALDLPWLRPAPRREVRRLYRERIRPRRPDWRTALGELLESRYHELTLSIFHALASDADVTLVQPFCEPCFLGALVDVAPATGFPSRSVAMETLFGDLLPRRSIQRVTKASFTEVFYGPLSRRFAEAWDGRGVDSRLVDPTALRAEWLKPRPDFRAMTLLQAAWLASREAA